MNVYRHELRALWRPTTIWIAVLSLTCLLFMSMYPAFRDDIETSRHLLENFPPVVRTMFGLNLSAFFTFVGFYAYMFTYLTLIGAIQAMNLGLGVMVRESQSKTTDFLLTKPITRTRVFVAKLMAMLTMLVATFVVFCGVASMMAWVFGAGSVSWARFMGLNVLFLCLMLWFMAFGILISQLARKVRSVVAYTLAWVFGLFVVGLIGAVIGEDKVRFVTPFKYVDYMAIATSGAIDARYAVVGAAIALTMLVVGYVLYVRRDKKAAD